MSGGQTYKPASRTEDTDPWDHYPTEDRWTRALLQRERLVGKIWEPACGDGAITRVLEVFWLPPEPYGKRQT